MANRIKHAFDSVKADSRLKESTMQFLDEQRYKRKHPLLVFQKAFAAVCALFILAAGIGGYSWIQTPVSYLSIDINPSIELALNPFDRVVSATAYNAQGETLLKELSLKGKKYTEAIDAVTDSSIIQKYLAQEEELVITVAAGSSRKEELLSGVESCCSHIGHSSRSVTADPDIVSDAHENGLSVGKYQAYLALSQYDDTVTVHECKDMSMTEIHGRILEHEHGHENNGNGDGEPEQETENTHHAKETEQETDAKEPEQEAENAHHAGQTEQETEQTHHGAHHD